MLARVLQYNLSLICLLVFQSTLPLIKLDSGGGQVHSIVSLTILSAFQINCSVSTFYKTI